MELQEILEQALNPEAIIEITSKYSPEHSLILENKESTETAQFSRFRIQKINGKDYIICPIPFLFNEERKIETGFAIDVSQDYFMVYPFMQNWNDKKTLILQKLPHCVHKAIKLDTSKNEISEEIVQTANETSAILFISNMLNDLSVGIESPLEFFDDKLYQQLINRILTVKEPGWENKKVIDLRFKQILKQYEYTEMDPENPMYENNMLRNNISLCNLLFGCEDNFPNQGLISFLPKEEKCIEPYVNDLYQLLFSGLPEHNMTKTIKNVEKLCEFTNILPRNELVQEAYRYILECIKDTKFPSYIPIALRLKQATNIPVGIEHKDLINIIYNDLIRNNNLHSAENLYELTNILPTENVDSTYILLLALGKVEDALKLKKIAKISPGVESNYLIQLSYQKCFSKGWIDSAEKLEQSTNIFPDLNTMGPDFFNLIQKTYFKIFTIGRILNAEKLEQLTNIKLSYLVAQDAYDYTLSRGWVEHAEKIYEYTKIPPQISVLDKAMETL
ncbi:MAG: hypothetical protein PHW96_00550, partial [Candidatus Nanoarchaeia archaeon]|nr:hypothetical protein [Candidatus Nanoarchaeia archaeon]